MKHTHQFHLFVLLALTVSASYHVSAMDEKAKGEELIKRHREWMAEQERQRVRAELQRIELERHLAVIARGVGSYKDRFGL